MYASFSVAWKNARAKAPYTAGESLIKPAAVKIARITCSDVVGNKLAMVLLSNNTVKRHIQELSVDNLKQTIVAAKRSGNVILEFES